MNMKLLRERQIETQLEFSNLFFVEYCKLTWMRNPIKKFKIRLRLARLQVELDKLEGDINAT